MKKGFSKKSEIGQWLERFHRLMDSEQNFYKPGIVNCWTCPHLGEWQWYDWIDSGDIFACHKPGVTWKYTSPWFKSTCHPDWAAMNQIILQYWTNEEIAQMLQVDETPLRKQLVGLLRLKCEEVTKRNSRLTSLE